MRNDHYAAHTPDVKSQLRQKAVNVLAYRRKLPGEEREQESARQNLPDIYGEVHFTQPGRSHDDKSEINVTSSSRSSTRNRARPSATTTNGSSATKLVHAAGIETRWPWLAR